MCVCHHLLLHVPTEGRVYLPLSLLRLGLHGLDVLAPFYTSFRSSGFCHEHLGVL